MRRLIAGYQARSYDQVALELIEALSEQAQIPEGPSKAMRTHLLAYSENANLWPNDAVTIQAVSQRNLGLYARRLVLAVLERNLIPSMAGNQRVPAGLHVEHLLPQGWRPQEWPLPSGIDPEQAEEERNQALATLGKPDSAKRATEFVRQQQGVDREAREDTEVRQPVLEPAAP